MTRKSRADERSSFRREWNFALGLVAGAAVLLLAAGQHAAGVMAVGVGAAGIAARWRATRRRGRGFYE